jgi:hypothetical protein
LNALWSGSAFLCEVGKTRGEPDQKPHLLLVAENIDEDRHRQERREHCLNPGRVGAKSARQDKRAKEGNEE